MHDPLDELLAPHPTTPPRPDVFDRTVRVLRRQRRIRQLSGIGILTAAYAAGLLTILVCQPPMELDHPGTGSTTCESRLKALSVPLPAPSASELEWQALEAPEAAPVLYRQAGDRYLADADPAEAVRCYGNALAESRPQDLEVALDDSWLLMVIKQARMKERNECDK